MLTFTQKRVRFAVLEADDSDGEADTLMGSPMEVAPPLPAEGEPVPVSMSSADELPGHNRVIAAADGAPSTGVSCLQQCHGHGPTDPHKSYRLCAG